MIQKIRTPKYETAMGQHAPKLRLTPQRRHVYDELMGGSDHPTATDVFIRVQKRMPSISLATVYNCLETMVAHGLVQAVHVDREPTRFCPNLKDHGHFICTVCEHVYDIELPKVDRFLSKLPAGTVIKQQNLTLRGFCANCSTKEKSEKKNPFNP